MAARIRTLDDSMLLARVSASMMYHIRNSRILALHFIASQHVEENILTY